MLAQAHNSLQTTHELQGGSDGWQIDIAEGEDSFIEAPAPKLVLSSPERNREGGARTVLALQLDTESAVYLATQLIGETAAAHADADKLRELRDLLTPMIAHADAN